MNEMDVSDLRKCRYCGVDMSSLSGTVDWCQTCGTVYQSGLKVWRYPRLVKAVPIVEIEEKHLKEIKE